MLQILRGLRKIWDLLQVEPAFVDGKCIYVYSLEFVELLHQRLIATTGDDTVI